MEEDFGKLAHTMLHKLWTKAVGSEGYVKSEWVTLQRAIANLTRQAEDSKKAA